MSDVDIARQSARGGLIIFAGNFISAGLLAVAAFVVARLLGPDLYGVYTLALLIPYIFQLFSGLGVNVAVTRYAAYHLSQGNPGVARRYTTNAILFLTLTGAVFTLATYLTASYLSAAVLGRPGLGPLVQYTSLFVLGQTVLQVTISAFMGWGAMGLASVESIIQSVLKVIVCPALLLAGLGVYGALAGHVSSYMVGGIIAVALFYAVVARHIDGGKERRFLGDIREMLAYGLPAFAANIVNGFASQFTTIVLAVIAVNVVVGYYQAAANITVAIGVASGAMTVALFPAFARLDGIRADTSLAFRYAVKYIALFITPIIFFLFGAAEPFFLLIYGPSYSPGIVYLQLLALSNAPLVVGLVVLPSFFNGIGKTRLTLLFSFVSSVVQIALAAVLGISAGLGVYGLIYSNAISNVVGAVLGLYLSARLLNARIDLGPVTSMIVASLLPLAPVYLIGLWGLGSLFTFIVDILVFLVLYMTLVPTLRGLDENDLMRLGIAVEGLGVVSRVMSVLFSYERLVLRLWKRQR